jgi:serine/threonine protein phosphatase PrpC
MQVGHKAGIIPEPQISCHHIGDNDKFLILASDGVFDVMSNQDVVDMLASHATNQTLDDIDLQCVCDAIVTEATKRFVDRDEVSDDTSIIIVRL